MQRSGGEGHLEMTVKRFICPRMRASKEEEALMKGSAESGNFYQLSLPQFIRSVSE